MTDIDLIDFVEIDGEIFIAFMPVPAAQRRWNGWTATVQHRFIRTLSLCGSVERAARAVGQSVRSAHVLKGRPGAESFARAWRAALQQADDKFMERRAALMMKACGVDRVPLPGEAFPDLRAGAAIAEEQRDAGSCPA